MIKQQTEDIKIFEKNNGLCMRLNQYDSGVKLKLNIFERINEPYIIDANDVISIVWSTPFIQNSNIKYKSGDNYIELIVPDEVTQKYGDSLFFNVIITNGDEVKGTQQFKYKVCRNAVDKDHINSEYISDSIQLLIDKSAEAKKILDQIDETKNKSFVIKSEHWIPNEDGTFSYTISHGFGTTDLLVGRISIDTNKNEYPVDFTTIDENSILVTVSERCNVKYIINTNAFAGTEYITKINENSNKIEDLQASFIEHITNHPGGSGSGGSGGSGGGSTSSCKITSTFSQTEFSTTDKIKIPIFFTSSNAGAGKLVVSVDNIEVINKSILQGTYTIEMPQLVKGSRKVSIYVIDKGGKFSNELNYTLAIGGLEISTTFNYEKDYLTTSTIKIPYTVDSFTDEKIITTIIIKNTEYTIESEKGYNVFNVPSLVAGVYPITMSCTAGKYISNIIQFNLVVLADDTLFISTNTTQTTYEEGDQISIDYRISMKNQTKFDIEISVDDELYKTLECKSGVNYFTISTLKLGNHRIDIKGITKDKSQTYTLEFNLTIIESTYQMVKPVTQGLVCWFDATDKSNQATDKDTWVDKSGNDTTVELCNINYNTNGWIDNALVLNSKAYAKINTTPFSDNAEYGLTIDILFETENVGNNDAIVLNCKSTGTSPIGADIKLNTAHLISSTNSKEGLFSEGEKTRITFVIDRDLKFGQIYINGVMCENMFLNDSNQILENFQHSEAIYLNTNNGTDGFGQCKIYSMRVYNRNLSHEEVLQNHISDIKDKTKQKQKYDFNFKNTMPTMYCYGDTTAMTKNFAVPMRIKYIATDGYGESFDLDSCKMSWQGTSSLQYAVKNYKIKLYNNDGTKYKYTPYKNGIEESKFCLKCDYMESSHANNTGLAKFVNDCLYDTPNPPQIDNPNVRTTINGFPIQLYINDKLIGVYNFNLDKGCTDSFGMTSDYPKCISYEVSANTDTTAGAFHKWTESTGKTMAEYYGADFELRYALDEDNQGWDELHRVISWVDDADDETFKNEIEQYFNKEYLIKYFLMVMMFGMVDNLGKNMMFNTWDGQIWYPNFYDLDTALGLNNSGYLIIGSDIEMEAGTFNTSKSKLWVKLQRVFADELKETYKQMRAEKFRLEYMIRYLCEEQIDKIPERLYNLDSVNKYLPYGKEYIHMLHGNRLEHMKKWIRERLLYLDTLYDYEEQTADFITIRANHLGNVYLDLQTYETMYLKVKWRNGEIQKRRITKGETLRFSSTLPTETDQEVLVYGAKYLKDIGDISNLTPSALMLGNATKLLNLTCHSEKLLTVNVDNMEFLSTIDLSGCSKLGKQTVDIDVSTCKNLISLNVEGTQLSNVILPTDGSNIETLILCDAIKILSLTNMVLLKTFSLPSTAQIQELTIDNCPSISRESLQAILNSSTLTKLKLVNTNLETLDVNSLSNITSIYLEYIDCINFNYITKNASDFEEYHINTSTITFENLYLDNTGDNSNYVLDLSKNSKLKSIHTSGTNINFKAILLPETIEVLDIPDAGGDIHTIGVWIPSLTTHDENYKGLDLGNMKTYDLLLNGINFEEMINLNTVQTNVFLKINGATTTGMVDYSNLTNANIDNLDHMFDGSKFDSTTLNVIPPTKKIKVNSIDYMFANSDLDIDFINSWLNAITTYTTYSTGVNCNYLFYNTQYDIRKINIPFPIYYCNCMFGNTSYPEKIENYTVPSAFQFNFGGYNKYIFKNSTINFGTVIIPKSLKYSPSYLFAQWAGTNIDEIIIESKEYDSLRGLFTHCENLTTAPKLTITKNITDICTMFGFCSNLIDFSNVIIEPRDIPFEDMSSLFWDCEKITDAGEFINNLGGDCGYMFNDTKINFNNKVIDTSKCTDLNLAFYNYDSPIYNITLDFTSATNVYDIFYSYSNVEVELTLNGSINNSLEFDRHTNLSVTSLNNIVNALSDNTGNDVKTITFENGDTFKKLTDDMIAIATNKNWSLVSGN